jgi:hypothetical protein
MEITELFCCLDQKLGIQFCSTKNTINSAQSLQLNSIACGRAGGLKKAHSNPCRQ